MTPESVQRFRDKDMRKNQEPTAPQTNSMRVSGFTFVRNAVRLEFPIVECIRSVLPMVDEFVVAVVQSDDGTEDLIRSIGDPRIIVIPTRWNPNVRTGGYVLAQ